MQSFYFIEGLFINRCFIAYSKDNNTFTIATLNLEFGGYGLEFEVHCPINEKNRLAGRFVRKKLEYLKKHNYCKLRISYLLKIIFKIGFQPFAACLYSIVFMVLKRLR